MTVSRFVGILTIFMLWGCTPPIAYTTSYLFPVRGPISTGKPIPVIPVSVRSNLNDIGLISFSLPNGETFSGQWSRNLYINANPEKLAQLRETDINLAWDAVYGDGYYLSTVLGSLSHNRSIITGSQGTVIQLEFNGAKPWLSTGVAKDDKGNIYKLVIP
ncbi:hypothetical protein L4X63_05950 [Geomonas sp. Red32]|uniref:hypothetical protein n=1 Tax=Geomonas sp. Red32 TaxID=2912856 RepID=UPI00202D0AD6|nr:hypothetical protein [Geomonas sp. Red32]MCM0081128.1 hypothetical protein [Geomonas sp. Red32]